MTTKHTPGPWEMLVARTMVHLRNAAGALVASLPFKTEEEKANARLIAAAPDLLAALQEALAYNDAVTASDGTGQFSWGPQARAAIAKATKP